MTDKTLIWVGNNDPMVAQSIASTISETLDMSEIDIVHSKKDNKSMMEVMRQVDPNFFQKNVRHTYQDLYMQYADRQENATCMLEFIGAVGGEQHKQSLVDGVVNYLKTGVKPVVKITNGDEPAMYIMPNKGELEHVQKE